MVKGRRFFVCNMENHFIPPLKKSPEALKSLKDPNVKMDIKNRMIIEKTLDFLVKENG